MKALIGLLALCALAAGLGDGTAAAASARQPLRLSMAWMRVQMDGEERGHNLSVEGVHGGAFESAGGRALRCRRRTRTSAFCTAAYWGSSEIAADRGGTPLYRHRDCTERLTVVGESEDWGGFFPILRLRNRPSCVAYVSPTPISPLWGVRDYARQRAMRLAKSLGFSETESKVSECRRELFEGSCHIEYSGGGPPSHKGLSREECTATVRGKLAPSGRVRSIRVSEKSCRSYLAFI